MWRLLRKANPSSLLGGGPISKHISGLGMNKYLVVGPGGARNQELLCWRAIYCHAMLCQSLNIVVRIYPNSIYLSAQFTAETRKLLAA
jgi:hypothetical protein